MTKADDVLEKLDSLVEEKEDDVNAIVALSGMINDGKIVIMGKTFRVARVGKYGMNLLGPKGGQWKVTVDPSSDKEAKEFFLQRMGDKCVDKFMMKDKATVAVTN